MKMPARALVLLITTLWIAGAHAQTRPFPPGTRLGTLEIEVFPKARLDGREIVIAPGARIFTETNAVAMPSTIRGAVQVRYSVDTLGQVSQAWILTAEELQAAREAASR